MEKPQKIPKEDLLLHPVRMRIILAAASRQEITSQKLVDELPDIPQATLYRNIKILSAAGVLVVVKERRTRNTVEKTFAFRGEEAVLNAEDLAQARPEDHMRQFTEYLGLLLGYYARYVSRAEKIDPLQDGVSYRLLPVSLNQEEAVAMAQALNAALIPFLQQEPRADRKRYVLGVVTMPDSPGGRPTEYGK
jgi:DNA-binding transcriptional ArsR family regulator